ncbi:enkurin domain-containing protein 1 isoform X6 [Lagopus muta]|uniref:enkurin domain-containing protein 1 isoform X6 n=1 Tax=Lagopus muta TaxID=64668 RepID=UPI00209ED813|nr:enkurin domain-containing protein 1 isoform X6 [Lagopus muta]
MVGLERTSPPPSPAVGWLLPSSGCPVPIHGLGHLQGWAPTALGQPWGPLGLFPACRLSLQLGVSSAIGRDRDSRMCEGPSKISGPIPPDPTLFPNYYRRPFSARGRLEGNAQQLDFTSRPTDSAPSSPRALRGAHQPQPAPRIRPSGRDFLEKGQKGTLGLLLQLDGLSLGGGLPAKRKESKDHEKENVRRIKEIQKKCKERERAQEHSQPKPVKALWKSQKYENVESKVKARLQESEGNSWHGAEQPSENPCPEVHPAGFSAFHVWGSCQKAVVFCPTEHCPHPFCMALRQRRRDRPSGCCRLCASSQDPVTHSGFYQLCTELKHGWFLFRVVSGFQQLLSFPSSGYFFLSWCFK